MANGYFERGEMYDILSGDAMDGEILSHRPGIIVSSERGNRTAPVVTMIFTTTTTRDISVNHRFTMRGKEQYALCSQIVTVNKKRLTNYYGKLSDSDMRTIDSCLEEALDLGYVDDTAVKEKEKEISVLKIQVQEQSEETAKLAAKITTHADEITSMQVEIEMWKRLYEKALDQVCSMKLTGDITKRTTGVVTTTPQSNVQKNPPLEETHMVDINTAKFSELKSCGLTDNIIATLITRRPHKSVEDLKGLPGVTSMMYQIVSKKLCCVIQPQKKSVGVPVEQDTEHKTETPKVDAPNNKNVNINTAPGKEIKEMLGVGNNAAYAIPSYRKKHGPYLTLEELANTPYWSEKMVEKHRSKMEVGL